MLSGAVIPRLIAGHVPLIYALAWPGWMLLAYRRLLAGWSISWLTLTVLIASIITLSGHLQISLFVLLIPVSHFVFFAFEAARDRAWRRMAYGAGVSLLAALLTAGLCAAQLLPIAEAYPHTARGAGMSYEEVTFYSFHPWLLPTLVAPFLFYHTDQMVGLALVHLHEASPYAGLIPLTLAVFSLSTPRGKQQRLAWFLGLVGAAAMIIAMGRWTPVYRLVYAITPFFRVPGRYLLIWVFAVSVMSGLGLEALLGGILTQDQHRIKMRALGAGGALATLAILAAAGAAIWPEQGAAVAAWLMQFRDLAQLDTALFVPAVRTALTLLAATLGIMAGAVIALATVERKEYWAWIVVGAVAVEMALFAWPLIRGYPVRNLYDPTSPLATLDINPAEVRLSEYLTASNYLVPILNANDEIMGLQGPAAIRALGVGPGDQGRHLLAADFFVVAEPSHEPGARLLKQVRSAYLYASPGAWPRLYAAPAITIVESDRRALRQIGDAQDFLPFQVAVVVEGDSLPDLPPPEATGRYEFSGQYLEYRANGLQAEVQTNTRVMVIFSETYYPGWLAWVDEEPAPIWRVNYNFRGVVVEPGEHIIEMAYCPLSFRVGATISIVTLVGLALATGVALIEGRSR